MHPHTTIGCSPPGAPQRWMLPGLIVLLIALLLPARPIRAATSGLPAVAPFANARFNFLSTTQHGAAVRSSYGAGMQTAERIQVWADATTRPAQATFIRNGAAVHRNDGSGWRRVRQDPLDPTAVAALAGRLDQLAVAAASVAEIGVEQVGETPTTHYQVWLRPGSISGLFGPAIRWSDAERGQLAAARAKVDLWIGQSDRRIRQHSATLQIPTAPATEMTTLITYTGFDDPSITIETPPDAVPRYEPGDCRFEVPQGLAIDCGALVVPEDRAQPDGSTIRLAVAILRSPNPNKAADPLVYLEGGPGGNAVRFAPNFARVFAPFLATRDLILFDQRGAGLSEPALTCPEYDAAYIQELVLNRSLEEADAATNAALESCAARLAGDGATLAAYTSAGNAADLADLRVALGYDQWNLLGISYGTRLALTAMRDQPSGIRSVILDSTYPPQANLYADIVASADRSFRALFSGCAADPACNATYPHLEAVFYTLVDQLNARPVTVEVTNPATQEPLRIPVDGDQFLNLVFSMLYQKEIIPALPKLIYDTRDGDTLLLERAQTIALASLPQISRGMYFAVECNEEVPFTSEQELKAAGDKYPRLRTTFIGIPGSIFSVCRSFNTRRPGPIENQPVQSSIPTLVLAGQYDPITPPAWGQLAAATLPNSFYYLVPDSGHGETPYPCAASISVAFLNNPTTAPDAACLAATSGPDFDIPGEPVALRPFEGPGFRGVKPEGWVEARPGVYARSGFADVVISQRAVPATAGGARRILESLQQTGAAVTATGTRPANGRLWTLYTAELGGQRIDLALADAAGGAGYAISLTSPPGERDFFVNALFLPAVDAFAPAGP